MTQRKVLKWPDPSLRKVSSKVSKFDAELAEKINDMYDTLRAENGAGIAAPQIGIAERIVLIDCSCFGTFSPYPWRRDRKIWVLVNPEIHPTTSRKEKWVEACLSVPGMKGEVVRAAEVEIKTNNFETGTQNGLIVRWPLSGAIQHECDHLDGIVYLDRMKK
tara:strand:- start:395 stop:880 length:486 start_codon:yes stop_codon:yes gene_type:complete